MYYASAGCGGCGGCAGFGGFGGCGGGGGGGSDTDTSNKDQLVARVKERQRQGEGEKQAWYEFCRSKGTSNYDPNRHDEATLKYFLDNNHTSTSWASGQSWSEGGSTGCSDQSLVQRVKDWQRRGEGHKQAWYSFCRRNGSDKYDPSRYDASTLREFIAMVDAGEIQPEDGWSSWGGGGGCSWGGGGGWGGWDSWGWMPMKGGKGGKGMDPWSMMQMMNMWMGGKGGNGCSGYGPVSGSSDVDGRPGDWVCDSCGNVNFSRRDECNKCGAPRKGAKRLGMKQGDWICPNCGDLVFANKPHCTMCGYRRKPEEEQSNFAGGHRSNPY